MRRVFPSKQRRDREKQVFTFYLVEILGPIVVAVLACAVHINDEISSIDVLELIDFHAVHCIFKDLRKCVTVLGAQVAGIYGS